MVWGTLNALLQLKLSIEIYFLIVKYPIGLFQ